MRNLIFSILGSMGLALLGLPAFLSAGSIAGPAEKDSFHGAFDFGAAQLPLRAVADDDQSNNSSDDENTTTDDDNQGESTDHSADNDTDDSGSVSNDTSQSSDKSDSATKPVPQVYRAKHPHGPKKALQVDLSDLVIRPV